MALRVGSMVMSCELALTALIYELDRVVVQIDAVASKLEAASCQADDEVPVTVVIAEPIGRRALVDGGRLQVDAQGTLPCGTIERFAGGE